IRWTNQDTTTHTSTSDSAVWDSGNIATNGSFSFAFDTPGAYPYHCSIHPSMTGTIVVQPGCPPPDILVGHLTWQGAPAPPGVRLIQPYTLTLKSGVSESNYLTYDTDASGFFTLPTGLPNGVYSYRLKG